MAEEKAERNRAGADLGAETVTGAAAGAAIGGAAGTLARPPGVLVGGAIGAAAGGVMADAADGDAGVGEPNRQNRRARDQG